MIYITAMRVVSPNGGLGVNIYLYLPKRPLDARDPWGVALAPGPYEAEVAWQEVKSSGAIHDVEAYLDIILEDGAFDRERLGRLLRQIEKEVSRRASNPAKMKIPDEEGVTAYAVFSVNIGLEDLVSKRRVLGQLRDALMRWSHHYRDPIERALQNATPTRRVAGQ